MAGLGALCLVLSGAPSVQAQANSVGIAPQATYQQVLANPDDLALNVAYLDAQLGQSDFAGAAVTLQRILLLNPRFDEARLIRAAVFLRLGDNAAALADLAYLEGRPLSAEDRAEADRLGRIAQGSSGDPQLTGVLRFGTFSQSNPSRAPGSGIVGTQPFAFAADSRFGGFGELLVLGELPFGGGAGHALLVSAHGLARAHTQGSQAQSIATLTVGPRFDMGFAFFDIEGVVGAEFVGSDLYGSRLGVRATVTMDLADRLSAALRVDVAHDAVDVNLNTTGSVGDGDGLSVRFSPSATYRISDAWAATASVSYDIKDAGSPWFSYDRYGGGLALVYRNAAGYRVEFGGSAIWTAYDAPNPNLVATTLARDETQYALNAALAVPVREVVLAFQGERDAVWAADWSFELFGRYDLNRSNVAVYDSDNVTVGLSVARRFSL